MGSSQAQSSLFSLSASPSSFDPIASPPANYILLILLNFSFISVILHLVHVLKCHYHHRHLSTHLSAAQASFSFQFATTVASSSRPL